MVALGAILILGGGARLVSSALVPLIFDEYQWIAIADRVSLSPVYLPLHGDAHPAGGAYVAAIGSWLLGSNAIGYRFGSVACGTVLIWIAWRLALRQFGPTAGLVAAALAASNEYLLGISRLATQESAYLAAATAAVLFFVSAMERGDTSTYAVVGILLGLGLFLKEMTILWVPVFAWELASRNGPRALLARGPAIALIIMLLGAVPDVVWNIWLRLPVDGVSDRGLLQQVGRLGMGWSFGPTALFLRPVFSLLENAVSEYPAISTLPGLLLLGGALGSFMHWRVPDVRLWLRLGWVPFLFFTLVGNPSNASPEFWWSDLSVVPFVMLTASLTKRLAPYALAVGLLLAIPGSLDVVAARENCYPSAATSSGPVIERCFDSQRMFVAHFRDRDHGALSLFGSMRLPVADHYERWGRAYVAQLEGKAPTESHQIPWPRRSGESIPEERQRMERMLDALQGR